MITDNDVKKAVERELKPIIDAADKWHETILNALDALRHAIGGKK